MQDAVNKSFVELAAGFLFYPHDDFDARFPQSGNSPTCHFRIGIDGADDGFGKSRFHHRLGTGGGASVVVARF